MHYIKRMLVILFLAVFLVACSSGPEEIVPDYVTEAENVTFGGATFTFMTGPDIIYDPDSLFGDIARQRVSEVSEKYDVNIVFNENSDIVYDLMLYVSSGIKPVDVMFSDPVVLRTQIRANLLYPVDTFSTGIDYKDTNKWGGREHLIGYAWNDHLYGLTAMYWPESVWRNIGYFFYVNENIISRLNTPDPREYVENGEWTRDRYEQVLEEYTHQDNNGETVYALTAMPGHYFSMAIKASGIDYVVKQSNGKYTNAYLEPGALDKLTWAYDSYWNNYEKTITHDTDTFTTIAQFVSGKAVMLLMEMYWGMRDVQYEVEDFGLLPFPLSDDLAGSKWIGQFEDLKKSMSFIANIEETDALSTVVNAIFEPLPGYETEEERYEYYDRYVFHDPRDTRLVFECVKNCRYIPYYDSGYLIPDAMRDAEGNRTISQILESNAKVMDNLYEKVYIPMYESCDSLWGEE